MMVSRWGAREHFIAIEALAGSSATWRNFAERGSCGRSGDGDLPELDGEDETEGESTMPAGGESSLWILIIFDMTTKERDHHELAEDIETKLCAALEDQDFDSLQIDPLLNEYRALYVDLIVNDCEDALRTPIEDRLWEAHIRINGRFRKQLGYFRHLKGKKKPVEQRKAATRYLRFLKASQRFYRGYIQKLATHTCGIAAINLIAQNFGLSGAIQAPEEGKQTTPELQHAVLRSCQKTLVHLGDLSRYRESELDAKGKQKNWAPAIGYYDRAIAINPSSGTPHNQLAIIARIQGKYTSTLYHLYRAQSATEPPPTATDNLALELKKLRETLQPADLAINGSDAPFTLSKHIQRCFPLLHSCCFDAIALQEYVEIEDKVLGYLCEGLWTCTLSTEGVSMMVLSNIAADFVAGDRWQADPEEVRNEHAFKLIQRMNIQTYSSLLQTVANDYCKCAQEGSRIETVTSTFRRLLPSLRYYSSWLISRAGLLSMHLGDSTMDCVLKDFWAVYTKTMSLLLSAHKVNDLPRLEYLLEEDADIIGFRPLQEVQLQRKPSVIEAFARRTRHSDLGYTPMSSDVEMQCRIRDILEDTHELVENNCVPLKYLVEEKRFIVVGDWIGSSQPSGPSTQHLNRSQNISDDLTSNGATSQETSISTIQSTKGVQGDDDNVAHRPSNTMPPPPSKRVPSGLLSTQHNSASDTSYSAGNTTLKALKSALRQTQQQATTQDSTESEHSDTTQPYVDVELTSSEASEMPDPTQAPTKVKIHRLHPERIKESFNRRQYHLGSMDDFDFRGSDLSPDSSHDIRRSKKTESTPPNGQG
ncbi:MAG: hypothetical protein Q9169_001257 [Polycauliona sp. 2 TL-2023]